MIHILVLMQESHDGCTWYRIKNFADTAHRKGIAKVTFLRPLMSDEEMYHTISSADIFFGRLNDKMVDILDDMERFKNKKPIVLDIDDKYEDIDPLSDHYWYLGTEEVQMRDGTYLWQDGKNNFDIKENKERIKKFENVMSRVSTVFTTTFNLKNYAQKFNDSVVIMPNAIDFELFPRIDIRKDKRIKVVWSGGSSHYSDLMEIKPVLKELMYAHPTLEFHNVGQTFKGFLKDMPEDRIFNYRWLKPDGHGYRMASIGADIALAPLTLSDFNTYKSSIKYYEYSALGIPTIARNLEPYKDDIVHNENGLLYDSLDSFRDNLTLLINNPIDRIRIGNNAYNYVKKYRDVKEITKDWVSYMEELVTLYKKKEDTWE
jgi:glycosyltransferase involved in cell wall biosynthesis